MVTEMTILQINKFFFPHRGAERYFFELSALLRMHGHEVVPFAMQHPQNLDTPYARYFPSYVDFEYPRIGFSMFKDARRFWWSREAADKLEALLRKVKPDVAHLHNIYHQLSPSMLPVFTRHHIPVVMTVHDYHLISPNYNLFDHGHICESFRWSPLSAIRHRCVKDSYLASLLAALEVRRNREQRIYERHVDRFLVPSQFTKDLHARWGFEVGKMEVLPLFVTTNYQLPTTNSSGNGAVLFVGALTIEKGISVLVDAAQRLPAVQFKIAGAGHEEARLRREAPRNVSFLGSVAPDKIQDLMRAAALVVVPSLWYENFPLVVAEAMAAGRPVVASRIGGIPEMMREGETGLLCSPGNPERLAHTIQKLMDYPDLRARMGARAAEIARMEYHPEQHYQKMMRVYEKLVTTYLDRTAAKVFRANAPGRARS